MHFLRRRSLVPAAPLLFVAIVALPAPKGWASTRLHQRISAQLRTARIPLIVAQDDNEDEDEVSTDEIEKYVSVYKAMQRNRSLTADQAAAAQGLTIEQFRQLENRVQRDDAALQQVREELQAAAQGSPAPRGSR
jgi:DNA-directed RNA polymerase sigma subunit (sigma70/sigma32)